MRSAVVASLIVVVIIVSAGAGYLAGSSIRTTATATATSFETTTATTTEVVTSYTSTYCTISGPPGGISVRFLNSSTMAPIAGVYVVAVNRPFYCSGYSTFAPFPAGPQTVTIFTTSATEWYPLSSDSNAAYSIAAFYEGHSYNFTADLRPVSLTCATLYIPSGETNVTITTFGENCYSGTPPTINSLALANVTISGYPGEIAVNPNASKIYVGD